MPGLLFPSSRAWMEATHPRREQFASQLPGATVRSLSHRPAQRHPGGSRRTPALVLDAGWRRQTSYFERLEHDHPDELDAGLKRLAEDLERDGAPAGQRGTATIIAWRKPSGTLKT